MSVAYHIVAHRNPGHLRLLVDLICEDDRDCIVLLHVDATASADVHAAARLASERYSRVHVQRSREVRWGGYSLVGVFLGGIRQLMRLGAWSHYVNLSGADLPLTGTAELAAHLGQHMDESWIQHFDPLAKWENPRRRIDPVWRETQKSKAVHRSKTTLPRRWLLGHRPWRGQSAWMVLARPHCELAISPVRMWNLHLFFRWSLIPNESFFATALTYRSLRIHNDDKRFIRWVEGQPHPELLDTTDLPAALRSGAWFARKFDVTNESAEEIRSVLRSTAPSPSTWT